MDSGATILGILGGVGGLLGSIALPLGVWLTYRANKIAAEANIKIQEITAKLNAQTSMRTAELTAETAEGNHELEARKIVDQTMLKLADTLNARVNTVETENVTIRGLLRECEKQHADTRVQFTEACAQNRHYEAENKRLSERVSKLETRVDSVIVPAPAGSATPQNIGVTLNVGEKPADPKPEDPPKIITEP